VRGERWSERVRVTSSTSPRGYHALAGGQAWRDHVRTDDGLPSGQRVIGLCQADEMALWPGRLVGANPERLTRPPPTLSNT